MKKLLLVLALLSLPFCAVKSNAQGIPNFGGNGVPNGSGGGAATSIANPLTVAPSSAPSSSCNTNSYSTAFTCDLSKLDAAFGSNVTGAATLGQPTSGYTLNPNVSLLYGYYANSSGFNNSTSSNSGRTNGAAISIKADALGQGDTTVLFGNVFVNGARSGATSFLANPSGQLLGGQVIAGQAGVYLEPIGDIDCNDGGFDVACIGAVFNLTRSVSTGALGATWLGVRVQSNGSAAADAAFSASGSLNVGMDLSNATLGANQAALTLSGNERIYFNSTAGTFFPSAVGTTYLLYSSSNTGLQAVVGGQPAFLFTSSSAFIYGTTVTLAQNSNNKVVVTGAATGSAPALSISASSDTNQDLKVGALGTGNVFFTNAGSFSANGAVATTLGSVGPTGSHTTVQTWFTIKDSGGVVRYIPAF